MPRGMSLDELKKKTAQKPTRGQQLKVDPKGMEKRGTTMKSTSTPQQDIIRLQREATQLRKKGDKVGSTAMQKRISNLKKKHGL